MVKIMIRDPEGIETMIRLAMQAYEQGCGNKAVVCVGYPTAEQAKVLGKLGLVVCEESGGLHAVDGILAFTHVPNGARLETSW